MKTMECISQRCSVRRFTDQDVTNEQLMELIQAARHAPSWANTQCWEFIIVRDNAVKEKLAETMPETNPARKATLNAPVVLVACGKLGKSGFYKGNAATSKGDNWYLYDVGLATQNISLAAHDMGLGSVILGLFDSDAAGKVLNLPDSVKVVTLMPLGVPAKEGKTPPRKPLCEFVFKDQYENAWVSGDEANLCFIEDGI
ncbi:MAG: nitroreductase family protein [Deltaproteobacteria bacterium]|nr:nitroreductase family protein [Deltaproteobacteria bacterium]